MKRKNEKDVSAAKGELAFEHKKYVDAISTAIDEFVPSKKKRS